MQNQLLDEYMRKLRESKSISECEAIPVDEISNEQAFLFISYSHKDYKEVYADLAAMEQSGIKFWYDEGLRAGKHWDEEVKSILLHPCCKGVIFFISENLFLSKSVNQEIGLVCDKNAPTAKPYFSVNLTDMSPGHIIRAVMRKDDAVLDEAGLDTERIADLVGAFSDRQMYLAFSVANHRDMLIKEIKKQFPAVVGNPVRFHTLNAESVSVRQNYLEIVESGDAILLKQGAMNIGRDITWADYQVRSPFVGRRHLQIFCDKGKVWLFDWQSSNGTFVNDMRVAPMTMVQLHDGDVITLGFDKKFALHTTETQVSYLGDSCVPRTVPITEFLDSITK